MGSVGVQAPPPQLTGDIAGGGSEWVELIKARNDIDAHLLTGRLQEAGIETKRLTDRRAPGAWLYGGSNPWAPVMIYVRRFQLQDARITLAEISFDAPDAEGRPGTQSPSSSWRVPVLWWVTAVLLGLLFTAIGLRQVTRYIEPCEVPIVCAGGSGEGR